ncbi:hypothetical protein GJ496_000651 [Pomphorhynchus laevis]|nr:hypothetical protein GJ496_000651 [Pomphorhynchus laevis]
MDDYEHQFADYLIRYLSKDICNINQRLQSIIERSRKVRLILAKSNPPGTSGCSPNTNLFAKRHSCYDQGSDIYTSPLNVYHPVLSNLSLDKAK